LPRRGSSITRVRVEPDAWRDVIAIAEFIGEARKNPAAACDFLEEFDRKCEVYARQPGMGDLRDDLSGHHRSFTFRRWYLALYEPLSDGIRVLRVFDARRDYGRHFAGR
jgi:plasmid stabilization system protein ParE